MALTRTKMNLVGNEFQTKGARSKISSAIENHNSNAMSAGSELSRLQLVEGVAAAEITQGYTEDRIIKIIQEEGDEEFAGMLITDLKTCSLITSVIF